MPRRLSNNFKAHNVLDQIHDKAEGLAHQIDVILEKMRTEPAGAPFANDFHAQELLHIKLALHKLRPDNYEVVVPVFGDPVKLPGEVVFKQGNESTLP